MLIDITNLTTPIQTHMFAVGNRIPTPGKSVTRHGEWMDYQLLKQGLNYVQPYNTTFAKLKSTQTLNFVARKYHAENKCQWGHRYNLIDHIIRCDYDNSIAKVFATKHFIMYVDHDTDTIMQTGIWDFSDPCCQNIVRNGWNRAREKVISTYNELMQNPNSYTPNEWAGKLNSIGYDGLKFEPDPNKRAGNSPAPAAPWVNFDSVGLDFSGLSLSTGSSTPKKVRKNDLFVDDYRFRIIESTMNRLKNLAERPAELALLMKNGLLVP